MYKYLLLLGLSLMIFAGCEGTIGNSCVDGSGNIIRNSRHIGDFTNVYVDGIADVYVMQGNSDSIVIETDDNIAYLINTNLHNSTLYIDNTKSICPSKFNIYLTMKDIRLFDIDGTGSLVNITPIETDALTLNGDGTGDITFTDCTIGTLIVRMDGTADVKATGMVGILDADLDGTGDIDMLGLQAVSADVTTDGTGDIRVWAVQKLKAVVNGTGDIFYKGNPEELHTEVNGTGKIIRVE